MLVFPDGVGKPGAKRRKFVLGNGSRRWWCERSEIVVRMPICMSYKSTSVNSVMIIRVVLLWVWIVVTRRIVGSLKRLLMRYKIVCWDLAMVVRRVSVVNMNLLLLLRRLLLLLLLLL